MSGIVGSHGYFYKLGVLFVRPCSKRHAILSSCYGANLLEVPIFSMDMGFYTGMVFRPLPSPCKGAMASGLTRSIDRSHMENFCTCIHADCSSNSLNAYAWVQVTISMAPCVHVPHFGSSNSDQLSRTCTHTYIHADIHAYIHTNMKPQCSVDTSYC